MPNIADCEFVVIDTETTGLDPHSDALVEVAMVRVSPECGVLGTWQALIHPLRLIPVTTAAVHGITDALVRTAPTLPQILPELERFLKPDDVLVAHNAAFDRAFLPLGVLDRDSAWEPRPWLCTLRLARHLWPDAPTHSNQGLRYWLRLDVPVSGVHRAAEDATVTAALFRRLVETYASVRDWSVGECDLTTLLDYAASPITVTTMPFGKHQGKPLQEVPADYVRWLLGQADLDPDLRASLEALA